MTWNDNSPGQSLVNDPSIVRPIFQLAWPMFFGQLLDMSVGLTDTWLAGQYIAEPAALSAMNLTNYVLWFISSTFLLVGIGTTALVARSIGAGDLSQARHWTSLSLSLGCFLGLLPLVLILFGGQWVAELLNLEPVGAEYAARYWWWTAWALPAIMIEQVGGAALRAAGDTRSVMVAMIVTNIVDMLMSYGLVLGVGPLPELGWDGLAIGSVLGYYVGAAIMLLALIRRSPRLLQQFTWPWQHWPAVRRLLEIGIPGGCDVLILIGCQLLFVRVVNHLGDVAAGAHGIAIRLESLSFLSVMALQVAATTLVGQNLGAGQPLRAKQSVIVACLMGEFVVLVTGLGLYLGSDWLAAHFVTPEKQAIANLAAQILRIVCLAQPPLVILMILTGALRGAADTRWPTVVTLVGFLLVRIPLGTILAWDSIRIPGWGTVALLGWGLAGAWYAMAIDITLRAILITWRFQRGHWSQLKI